MMMRQGAYGYLLNSGRLFQEWLVDTYARVESGRLTWHRQNQDNIRADLYQNIQRAASNGTSARELGTKVILPSSFTGGPRYMMREYQDAMAIVRGELYDCATIQSRVAFVIPYAMMMDDVWIITLSCNMRVMTCMLLFTSMCHILSALHRTWSPRLLHHHDLQS